MTYTRPLGVQSFERPATADSTGSSGSTAGVSEGARRSSPFRRVVTLALAAVRRLFATRDPITDYNTSRPVPVHLQARVAAKRAKAERRSSVTTNRRLQQHRRGGGDAA